jgi:pyridinium-3,5-bisthiocarboxylic acid mononucleotide nickel chelatase
MTVAALRDLGVPEEVFQSALSSLRMTLPSCRFERGERGHISGWRFLVAGAGHEESEGTSASHHHHHSHSHNDQDHVHDHTHDHTHGHTHTHEGDAHGRTHAEIVELLRESGLDPEVKRRALSLFGRIAVAEGAIHGVPPENVGFHEVGAEDSIADIVCACAGFAALKIDRISCGPLIEGTGHIHCAHGTFPLPAPATIELLKGIPFRQVEEPWEHITPTGAALLAEFSNNFAPMPGMMVSAIVYGLGSRQTPNRPNVLRLILGEAADPDDSIGSNDSDREEIVELRCNLDDLTPELASSALDSLLSAGALDATLTPTVMKKGRSGWILDVLCHPAHAGRLEELILRETTTFGVRRHRMERLKLERHHGTVETPYGPVSVKIGSLNGTILQQSPEFSSCADAAAQHGVAVRLVHTAAIQALSTLC